MTQTKFHKKNLSVLVFGLNLFILVSFCHIAAGLPSGCVHGAVSVYSGTPGGGKCRDSSSVGLGRYVLTSAARRLD